MNFAYLALLILIGFAGVTSWYRAFVGAIVSRRMDGEKDTASAIAGGAIISIIMWSAVFGGIMFIATLAVNYGR